MKQEYEKVSTNKSHKDNENNLEKVLGSGTPEDRIIKEIIRLMNIEEKETKRKNM